MTTVGGGDDELVLLSTKKGDDALTLCPHRQTHGGLNAKVHTAPSNFDREAIAKTFSTRASKAQLKQAGWSKAAKI